MKIVKKLTLCELPQKIMLFEFSDKSWAKWNVELHCICDSSELKGHHTERQKNLILEYLANEYSADSDQIEKLENKEIQFSIDNSHLNVNFNDGSSVLWNMKENKPCTESTKEQEKLIQDFLLGRGLIKIENDPVNHPQHYTRHPSGIECIEITRHMGFNCGNAIKYVWRADLKNNAIEDLKKAVWYLNDEIKKRESETK